MKGAMLAALATTGALMVACGSSPSTPTTPATQWPSVSICSVVTGHATSSAAIVYTPNVNGSDCPPDATTPIVKLDMTGDGSGYTCSGSVIGPHTVLTAAHCVANFTNFTVVWFGAGISAASPQTLGGIDVAVLHTTSTFPQRPLALISRDVNKGDPAIIAGYGATATSGASAMLRAGWTTITATDSNTVQAQYTPGATSGVCYGDSGGPILAQDSNGAWAVAGVTSTLSGNGCATSATTNQFVNVRNPAVLAFITNALTSSAAR